MIDEQTKKELKHRLESARELLLKEIKELPDGDMGNDVGDDNEEADESEEKQIVTSVEDTLKDRVVQIDSALNKMKTGRYGICESCNKNIPLEVLKIVPESRLCKNCKTAKK